jgi:hypothetical protein
MSGGGISVEFWQKNLLPLLITRLQELSKEWLNNFKIKTKPLMLLMKPIN